MIPVFEYQTVIIIANVYEDSYRKWRKLAFETSKGDQKVQTANLFLPRLWRSV
jgi:hypothetical protein